MCIYVICIYIYIYIYRSLCGRSLWGSYLPPRHQNVEFQIKDLSLSNLVYHTYHDMVVVMGAGPLEAAEPDLRPGPLRGVAA